MTDPSIIKLLIAAIIALSGAVVYLFKRSEKREKEKQQLIKDVLNAINDNNNFVRGADEVLKRVEKLLTNWRGH